jgi:hypothetical protein
MANNTSNPYLLWKSIEKWEEDKALRTLYFFFAAFFFFPLAALATILTSKP